MSWEAFKNPLCDILAIMNEVFVTVRSTEINSNNHQAHSPFRVTKAGDETPFTLNREVIKTTPQCDLCYRKFKNWTALYAHKGKLCFEEAEDTLSETLHVHIPKSELVYVQDCLVGRKLDIQEGPNPSEVFVAVKESGLEVLLRQLYTAQTTKYNIEQWYPSVANLGVTSVTKWLELSDLELKTIQAFASEKLAENLGMSRRPSNAELEQWAQMHEKLGAIMDSGKTYFCRLSTRSPKDGVSLTAEEKLLPVEERLQRRIDHLKVKTPAEVLNLIASSQRCFSDINFFFHYRVPGCTSSQMSIILRDWNDIPQDHEFRCYVVNKKLTAISQYQCYCKFDSLQNLDYVKKIREAIIRFHDKVSEKLPLRDYVIDVAVFPDLSCQMIELNPMGAHMSSGSALFNWQKDFDVLMGKATSSSSDPLPPIRILKQLIDSENEVAR